MHSITLIEIIDFSCGLYHVLYQVSVYALVSHSMFFLCYFKIRHQNKIPSGPSFLLF